MEFSITKNTPLKEVLEIAAPCRCNSCNHGCKVGSGLLADDDLQKLAEFKKISKEELKEKFLEEAELFNKKMLRPKLLRKDKKAYGQCIFYDDSTGCTVHPAKPLQCKAALSCSPFGEDLMVWFMINKVIDPNDPESIRQYSQYLKSGGKIIPGAELENVVKDKEKLRKILSYEIVK